MNASNSGGCTLNAKQVNMKTHVRNSSTTTLDNLILNHNINKIKLLKIDCEGSEYSIH